MGKRAPLTEAEKTRIYQGKLREQTLAEVAVEIGCSIACARKWWRRGRNHGLNGLRMPRHGRGPVGALSYFDPRIAEKALAYKRQHRRWGANRVLVELRRDPELTGIALPSRGRLAALFKERCPECLATYRPRPPRPARPPRVTGVHVIWQFDSQEGIRLSNGQVATIGNVRDPVGVP